MKENLLLATLTSFALTSVGSAATISVNFWNSSAGNAGNNSVDAGETAGVTGAAAQNWNNYGSASGTGAITLTNEALIDDSGAGSGAQLNLTSTDAFVGFSGAFSAAPAGPNRDLYNSFFAFNAGDNATITVSGLGTDFTGNGYRVYVYSDSDANNRDFTHTVGGSALTVVEDTSTFNGTFDEAVTPLDGDSNYVVSGVLSSGTFTITTSSSAGRAAINGFQIVAVPEPSSTALLGLGGLALILRRRK